MCHLVAIQCRTRIWITNVCEIFFFFAILDGDIGSLRSAWPSREVWWLLYLGFSPPQCGGQMMTDADVVVFVTRVSMLISTQEPHISSPKLKAHMRSSLPYQSKSSCSVKVLPAEILSLSLFSPPIFNCNYSVFSFALKTSEASVVVLFFHKSRPRHSHSLSHSHSRISIRVS